MTTDLNINTRLVILSRPQVQFILYYLLKQTIICDME